MDAGAATKELVVGALVGVLEPAPPADVVDDEHREPGLAREDILEQGAQADATREGQSASARIRVRLHDVQVVTGRIRPDHITLIVDGVPLVVGRHAEVLGREDRPDLGAVGLMGFHRCPNGCAASRGTRLLNLRLWRPEQRSVRHH